jgi:hypothetical protein
MVFSLLVILLLLSIFVVPRAYAISSTRNTTTSHNINITCSQIRADQTKLNSIANALKSVGNDGIGSTLLPSSYTAHLNTSESYIAQYNQALGAKASSLGC